MSGSGTFLRFPPVPLFEIDDRVEVRDVIDLGNGSTRYLINTDSPEVRYAHIRLGVDGAILQTIPIRGLTLRDDDETSVQYGDVFPDGSALVEMPAIVSSKYDDVFVRYSIFVGGVTFGDGSGPDKDFPLSDFDEFNTYLVTFLKANTLGGACHTVSVWQGNQRIAYYNR